MDTDGHVKLSELMEKENINEYAVNKGFDDTASLHRDSFGFDRKIANPSGPVQATGWRWPLILSVLIIVSLLLLSIVLQSVAVYRLINNSCDGSVNAVSSSVTGDGDSSTDAPTTAGGTTATQCDYGANLTSSQMSILKQLSELMDKMNDNTDVQNVYYQNSTDTFEENLLITRQSADKLMDIIRSLSSIQDTNVATESITTDILLVVQQLLKIQNSTQPTQLPKSCQEIKENEPTSPSGYYHINSQIVYCMMGELCGVDGGWSRLAYLDMSDATADCPSGFKQYTAGGIRACGRPNTAAGCTSVKFPSNGISYSQVCGKVVGYQYGTADGLDTRFVSDAVHNDINSHYLDGVSITYGYPRTHVWSLAVGNYGDQYSDGNCPCNTPPGGTQEVQSFVGNDYYCESGTTNYITGKLYTDDPLWDGVKCGTQEESCCTSSLLPWFSKAVNSTTDYLEMRICADQGASNEDAPVDYYEIYVK